MPPMSLPVLFVVIVVVAPLLETLLFQALPVFIARKCRTTLKTQIIVATIVFAVMHLAEGIAAFVAAGIIGGAYFGFAYAFWRQSSRSKAFWVTAGGHSIHNAIAFVLLLVEMGIM